MQRIIGYECFLENTITNLCENLGLKRKLLGINTNFITEAMKDKKPGKMKSGLNEIRVYTSLNELPSEIVLMDDLDSFKERVKIIHQSP